jgi:polyhydroxybutyrate depolymerase
LHGLNVRRDGYNTKPYKGNWNDLLGGANNNVVDIDDVGFISALVEWAIQKRRGDRRKVYIFGFSNGGTMVQRMIIERPNMFAAATAAVANLPAADVTLPSRGTPFFLMCGTKDNRMPYVGGVAADGRGVLRLAEATQDFFVAANHAGPNMIETMLPDTDPNDNCRIISQFYSSNTTPVQYYIMDGGGHNFAGKKSTIGGQPLPNPLVYA